MMTAGLRLKLQKGKKIDKTATSGRQILHWAGHGQSGQEADQYQESHRKEGRCTAFQTSSQNDVGGRKELLNDM